MSAGEPQRTFWEARPGARLGLAVAVVAVLFALTLSGLTPTYRTNDDASISMIAGGVGMASSPDEHLLFYNVALGLLLERLYLLEPDGVWYALLLIGVSFCSWLFLLYALLLCGPQWSQIACFALLFLIQGVEFVAGLQFTMVAFWAGASGILGLSALLLHRRRILGSPWLTALLPAGLLLLCSMIRLQCLVLVLVVGLPLLVYALRWTTPRSRRTALVGLAIALAASAAAEMGNRWYYSRDPGWRDFHEINLLRARLQEYAEPQLTPGQLQTLERVGWTPSDLRLLRDWMYDNEELFSLEKLRQAAEGWSAEGAGRDPKKALRSLRSVFGNRFFLIAALFLGARLLLFPKYCMVSKGIVALTGLVGLATLAALSLFLKTPPFHVYFPVFCFAVAVGCLDGLPTRSTGLRRGALWPVGAVLVLLGLVGIGKLHKTGREAEIANRLLRQDLLALDPQSDELYVVWGESNLYDDTLPLVSLRYLAPMKLLAVAAATHSPLARARMSEFGVTDLSKDLLENENLLLMSRASGHLTRFEKHAQERHGSHVRAETHFDGERIDVLRMRRVRRPGKRVRAPES